MRPKRGLLFLLTSAMGIGPVIMYGLSAISSVVITDLHISTAQFGLLATVCFLAATVASVWLGGLSDRASPRTLILIIFGGAAGGLALASVSGGYVVLLVAVAVSGAAQAMSNPATNRLISGQVPLPRRSMWVGVKQSGVQGSQFLVGLFFPMMAIAYGWRGAVGLAAAAVLVVLMISWRAVPVDAGLRAGTRRSKPRVRGRILTRLLYPSDYAGGVSRTMPLYVGYAFLAGAASQATNVYLPLFSQRELGFSLILAGLTVAVAGAVGVVSRVLWGRSIAWKVSSLSPLLVLGVGSAIGSSLLLVAGLWHSSFLLWCGVLFHGTLGLAIVVVLMASVMRDVSVNNVGSSSGVVALGMYLGFALGPLVMGIILGSRSGFFWGWLFVTAAYLTCVLLVLLSGRPNAAQLQGESRGMPRHP